MAGQERSLVEVVGAYRGRLLLLGEHARRLADAARATGVDPAAEAEAIERKIQSAWNERGSGERGALVLQSRRGLEVEINRDDATPAHEVWSRLRDPRSLAEGVSLTTGPLDREPQFVGSLRPKWFEAFGGEFDDLLRVEPAGAIVGTDRHDVFFVIDDVLVTPSIESGAFPGITRAAVIRAAEDLGIAVGERAVTVADAGRASDAFLTSSADGILSVRSVDERALDSPARGSRWRRLIPQLRLRVHELSRARFLPEL